MKKNLNPASAIWRTIMMSLSIIPLIFFIILLGGRWDYWQGWVFGIYILILSLVVLYVFRNDAELGKERMHPGPGIKGWDKAIMAIYGSAYLVIFILGPLDTGRFLWSPEFPIYLYAAGYIILTAGSSLICWGMYTNRWFSSVVRIQKDRKQKVVQEGPYKYIRHPGYAGGLFIGPAMALCFGSIWTLIPAAITVMGVVMRTYLEDKTLQKELPGYIEYTKKVRYRIIPGLW